MNERERKPWQTKFRQTLRGDFIAKRGKQPQQVIFTQGDFDVVMNTIPDFLSQQAMVILEQHQNIAALERRIAALEGRGEITG